MRSKTTIVKFRAVNRDIFQAIVDGRKRIETRAATPKYLSVTAGDMLMLVCGNERVGKKVKKVERFKTIGALLKKYKPEEINPTTHSVKEVRGMWYGFPGYKEKIKKHGLIVWQLM